MQSRRRAQPKAKEPWGIFGERGSLVPFSPTWVRSCALHEEWKGDSCDFSEPKEKGMASVLLSFHQLIVFVRRRSSRHVCASRTQNHTDLACRIKGRKTTQEKKGKRTYFWHSVLPYWTFYLIDFHDITWKKWYEKSEYEMMFHTYIHMNISFQFYNKR